MRALITGITGQDGIYLAADLHEAGYDVWGISRSSSVHEELRFATIVPLPDWANPASLRSALVAVQPEEIYHLSAQSSVTASWGDPVSTAEATGVDTLRLLDASRAVVPSTRIIVASSSEIFGEPERAPQNEQTPIRPTSPYGVAKAFAHHCARTYRRHYGQYVSLGILYNHESPRRPRSFVSQKIVAGAVAIARGQQHELRMGNLQACRDWGYAKDYVRAMRLMVQQPIPDDFVIATGELHSVEDFCDRAFAYLGLDYREHVVSDPQFWRPTASVPLVGDSRKARTELGWSPTISFQELIQIMVEAELARTVE